MAQPDRLEPEPAEDMFWGPSMGYMSAESERVYTKQVTESEGFDVDCYPMEAGNIVRPLNLELIANTPKMKKLYFLTNRAVELYNSNNPADRIKNPRIVKVNYFLIGIVAYYITFKAEDASGKTRTYQAAADADIVIQDSEIRFCRLKPKNAKRPEYTVPEDLLDEEAEEMMKKKRRTSSAEGQEDQSTNTSGFLAASSLAEPANAGPHPAREAEEAVEPLKNTGMEEQGEGTAITE